MSGRILIAGCGAVIALAAVIRFTGTSVPASRIEQLQSSNSEHRSPAYPPAMGGPDIVQAAPPTASESRNKIVNSAELHAVVSKITVQSPTIDKLAASEALIACAEFRPRRKWEPDEHAAARELAERCAGIRQNMGRNGAIDKAVELRASAEDDPSPLGRLATLARHSEAGKARWHAAEFALVNEALRSSDPVLISEAIRALHVQLDDGLTDSVLRLRAFAQAADLYVLHKGDQRTAFDVLVNCANLGRCANDSGRARMEHDSVAGGVRERSENQRLVEQYRLALQRRSTAAELLAIR
jgi:hypothetical protein